MKRYRTWIIIIVVVAGLFATAAPKIVRLVDINRYVRQVREASYLIEKVQARRPPECPPEIWEDATIWSSIAFGNVFFSPEHASFVELQKFTEELRSKLDGDVGFELLDWIWDRLAVTGIHGKRYVDRFRPAYYEHARESYYSQTEPNEPRPKALGTEPPLLTSRDELDRHIDTLVAIRGVVSRSKIPQIIGVDVDDPRDLLRGKEAYAVGIMRKWTATQEEIDAIGFRRAHRGPGAFFALYSDLSGTLSEARLWPPPTTGVSVSP